MTAKVGEEFLHGRIQSRSGLYESLILLCGLVMMVCILVWLYKALVAKRERAGYYTINKPCSGVREEDMEKTLLGEIFVEATS